MSHLINHAYVPNRTSGRASWFPVFNLPAGYKSLEDVQKREQASEDHHGDIHCALTGVALISSKAPRITAAMEVILAATDRLWGVVPSANMTGISPLVLSVSTLFEGPDPEAPQHHRRDQQDRTGQIPEP